MRVKKGGGMNGNVVIIFLGVFLITVSVILLLYFHFDKISKFIFSNIKTHIVKRKINKTIIAHNQKWKCADCKCILLNQYRISTIQNIDYAICIQCSNKYTCVEPDQCLV